MIASLRSSLRVDVAAFALIASACRSAPPAVGVTQECIEMRGYLTVVPGTVPDPTLSTTGGLRNPRTGTPAGLGALVIVVVDLMNRPVEHADVVVPDTDRGQTDKDGRIEFHLLAPTEHAIRIAARAFLPQELSLVSRIGFRDTVHVRLTTPSLGVPCDQRP